MFVELRESVGRGSGLGQHEISTYYDKEECAKSTGRTAIYDNLIVHEVDPPASRIGFVRHSCPICQVEFWVPLSINQVMGRTSV